jgi:hypothetical protein
VGDLRIQQVLISLGSGVRPSSNFDGRRWSSFYNRSYKSISSGRNSLYETWLLRVVLESKANLADG